ncbi:uncharacterized protein BT62DRAFT_1008400 [Guyanagaster necrorhizus]|uniref:Extracellular membrane protein CFEM domain-containing protein n=1 Tax=Guyanagaster necrorhizus TaxID=856835 RepID=A0A9P8AQB8_9AGAR|nr:uncharacterized protein BT62DRAFT_1008400 [Guyanagaster necrorhizus MCA 3950]KAG7444198.1 hypothetical protein BT62DRAFT_1008400 [Guyanagaster necrorhizus MCA 3950]
MISAHTRSFPLLAVLSLLVARVLALSNLDTATGSLHLRTTPGSINTTTVPDSCAWQCSILGTISMCGQSQLECLCSVSYQNRVSTCIDCYISADSQGGDKLNKLYQMSCENASSAAAAATQITAELAVASSTQSATSKSNVSSTLRASPDSALVFVVMTILFQF